jgi:hypothetical protein
MLRAEHGQSLKEHLYARCFRQGVKFVKDEQPVSTRTLRQPLQLELRPLFYRLRERLGFRI